MKISLLRIVNFLIDTSIYGLIIYLFFSVFSQHIPLENVKWIGILIYFLYYFMSEFFFGQTIGKWISKTRVVSITDNSKFYFWQILARTIMRFVPLDIISYIFTDRGFHDLVSLTKIELVNPSDFDD